MALNNNRLILNDWKPEGSAYVWYDPSDESSVRLQTGVSELIDKGSWGLNVSQTEASKQPAYGDVVIGGKKVISFDYSSQQSLQVIVSSFPTSDRAIGIAFKPKQTGTYRAVVSYNGDGSDFQIDAGDDNIWRGRFYATDYTDHFFGTSDELNNSLLLSMEQDLTNSELRGFENMSYAWTEPNFTGFDNTDITWGIGVNRNKNTWASMDFYEMLVVPLAEANYMRRYLAERWEII